MNNMIRTEKPTIKEVLDNIRVTKGHKQAQPACLVGGEDLADAVVMVNFAGLKAIGIDLRLADGGGVGIYWDEVDVQTAHIPYEFDKLVGVGVHWVDVDKNHQIEEIVLTGMTDAKKTV